MNIDNKYLIIRHSIREPITDAKDSYRQQLTEEGILLAQHLGKTLSLHSDSFTFFHSPVPRCKQTAISISEGIVANSKQVFEVRSFEALAGFFYRNWEYCAELMNRQEFTKKWLADEIPTDCIMPIKEAATLMLNEITSHNPDNVTKVFITHDFNVFCLKSLFFKTDEEMEVPTYLEGLVVSANKRDFQIFKQEHFTNNNKQ
jgi:broad specificity phosphatase PhoE